VQDFGNELSAQTLRNTFQFANRNRKKKRFRKIWSKELLRKRGQFSHINLLSELKVVPEIGTITCGWTKQHI
jgi:hypothetical protein